MYEGQSYLEISKILGFLSKIHHFSLKDFYYFCFKYDFLLL